MNTCPPIIRGAELGRMRKMFFREGNSHPDIGRSVQNKKRVSVEILDRRAVRQHKVRRGVVLSGKTPLLIQEGWLRHQEKAGEAHLSAADGVVGYAKYFVVPDHPVRSLKGGFAASLLVSRPPLLHQEGISLPIRRVARRSGFVMPASNNSPKLFWTPQP